MLGLCFWRNPVRIKPPGLLDFELYNVTLPCFCGTYVFPLVGYVIFMALTGSLLQSLQIYVSFMGGKVLTNRVLPLAKHPRVPFSEETVRDLKLMLCLFELVIYVCMFFAPMLRFSQLLLPYLLTKLALIVGASLLLLWRFVLQKPMTLTTLGLISVLVELHNFMYVLCLFDRLSRQEYCALTKANNCLV